MTEREVRGGPPEGAVEKQMEGVCDGNEDEPAPGSAEDVLCESRANLLALIDNVDDAVLFSDRTGTPVFFNRPYAAAIRELLGLEMRAGIKPHELLDDAEAKAAWDDNHRRVLSGEKFTFEYVHELGNGERRHFEVRFNPIRRGGEIIGFSEFTRDITERKRAEGALRAAHDDLERQVAERTEELRQTNEELREEILHRKKAEAERRQLQDRLRHSEKMEAIGELAGGVAHDFNNQLTGILGNADLLLKFLADPKLRGFAEGIAAAATSAAELTKQLLAFSRKGPLRRVPVDVHEVIGEVASLLERSVDKRIVIEQRLLAHASTTLGDPAQLQNALLNLAINGRDAMPDGGELVFETDVVALSENDCERLGSKLGPGEQLLLSVRDTGTGMDEKTRARMFEPFFTTKERGRGLGMGLASVYGTVTSHGGTIDVASEVGGGTTVELYLPLETAAHVGDASPPPAVASGRKMRVLVVDDEMIVRETLAHMLGHFGHEATICADGEEAIEIFARAYGETDLVILDMVMPKMSGRETFLALREIRPDVPVLVSTGYSLEGDVKTLIEQGACFIQKPFRGSALARAIALAVNGE